MPAPSEGCKPDDLAPTRGLQAATSSDRLASDADLVWLDGRLLPAGEAHVPALARGACFGDGCFETLRAYSGRVFRLDEHLARLGRSLRALDMRALVDPAGLRAGVQALVRETGLGNAGLRVTVTRVTAGQACSLVHRFPLPYPDLPEPSGLVPARARRNSRGLLVRCKTTGNALENMLEVERARSLGFLDALYLNERDELAECATSNLFVVMDGAVRTPPVRCGLLPGITRTAVLELARGLGLKVRKDILWMDDLDHAQEVFVTSTLKEVVPVDRLLDRPLGCGRTGTAPGPVTAALSDAYRALARG